MDSDTTTSTSRARTSRETSTRGVTGGRTAAAAIAAVAIGAFGALACGSASEAAAAHSAASGVATEAVAARSAASARVSNAVRAVRTAGRHVRHGKPYDVESERFRGRRVWEIKVASGRRNPHELLVSAGGRRVVRHTRGHKLGDDAPKALRAEVGLARALRTADRRAGGRFSEAEIDRARGGAIVWTATFERRGDAETEVVIDAATGEVLRVVRDDD